MSLILTKAKTNLKNSGNKSIFLHNTHMYCGITKKIFKPHALKFKQSLIYLCEADYEKYIK